MALTVCYAQLKYMFKMYHAHHIDSAHTHTHTYTHTPLDIVSTGAFTCRGARAMFHSGSLPLTYPCLMWLTRASQPLSPQAGISRRLQLFSFVLNSTYFKMPTGIHKQEGLPGWQGSSSQEMLHYPAGSGKVLATDVV